MSDPLAIIQDCVRTNRVEIADHAYDQMVERLIGIEDAIQGVLRGKLIEDYRSARKELRILVLQPEGDGRRLHTVWDLPETSDEPAILVTAYRPNRTEWHDDLMRRK